ncbi:MAG: glycosyltransferase, partial [Planctomycetota bacterium]
MDLLFDARLLHRGLSGIERVQANLLRELSALPEISRLRALVTRDFRDRDLNLPERVELAEVACTEEILSLLLHQDPEERPDVYLLSYFPDCNPRDIFLPAAAPASVVVVHDAILNRHPEYHPDPAAHAWYDRFVKLLLKGADRILCFSQSSAKEAVADLQGDPRRIDISPLAADPVMHQPLGKEDVNHRLGKLQISGDYFVALGKDYPHKQHGTLFKALARLPEHVHLVCAGSNVFPHERDGGETLEALRDRLGLTRRVR